MAVPVLSHYLKEADPAIKHRKNIGKSTLSKDTIPDFDVHYYTDITWKSHIDHIVEESVTIDQQGINLINATEGGCIHGGAIQSMTLKEALQKYAKT